MDMKNLRSQTDTSEVSLTNRVKDMGERISGGEEKVEKTDISVKENVKY